jgi:phosphonatase-like hydrolase
MVVFNMIGTTIEDHEAVHKALINTMGKFNYLVSHPEANAVMGYSKPEAIKRPLQYKESDKVLLSFDLIRFIHSAFGKEMNRYFSSTMIEPTEFALETLKILRERGIIVCLNTRFSKDTTDMNLSELKWLKNGFVNYAISSDEVRVGRPYPYMIQALMEKGGIIDPKKVKKVGDTIADLEEDNNAKTGLIIGVCNGANSRKELENHPHSYLIEHLGELPALLN